MDAERWNLVVSCLPMLYQQLDRAGADEWQDDTVYDAALDGLIRAARGYDPARAKFSTYAFYGIGSGVASGRAARRKEKVTARVPERAAPEPHEPPVFGPLFWSLRRLTPGQKRVIELRFREGLTQKETGDRLGLTRHAVYEREAGALRKLRPVVKRFRDDI